MHSRKNQQIFGHEKNTVALTGIEPGNSRLLFYVVNARFRFKSHLAKKKNFRVRKIANFSYCAM